jgi:phenylacetic acid degradation operon negative regulatory protein
VRDELQALGLEAASLVCGVADLDPVTEARARGLWDVAALCDGYRSSLRAIERSATRLVRLPARAAMVESFGVGGRVIRQLVLDPLLPEEIATAAEREALVGAMGEYDRLGRSVWAAFLGRFDVPHRAAPADTRIGAGVSRLEIGAGGPA